MLHKIIEVDSNKIAAEQLPQFLAPLISKNSKRELWKKEYPIPSWPLDLKTQNDNYLNGHETEIPADVLKKFEWLVENKISFKAMRKVITDSCEKAIEATQEIFHNCKPKFIQEVYVREEVKQRVAKAQRNRSGGKVIMSATNMPGDHHHINSSISGKFLSKLFNIPNLKKIFPAIKVKGRCDPPTFHLGEEKLNIKGREYKVYKEQSFSAELLNNEKVFFNLGNGTWRVELSRIEFAKMIEAMQKEVKYSRNHKVKLVKGITKEEPKTAATKNKIVIMSIKKCTAEKNIFQQHN